MKISILDDYHDTLRTLRCFSKLAGHDVTIEAVNESMDDALFPQRSRRRWRGRPG